jgi:hypothetical protein
LNQWSASRQGASHRYFEMRDDSSCICRENRLIDLDAFVIVRYRCPMARRTGRLARFRAQLPDGDCAAGVAMLLEVPLVVLLGPVERGRRGDLSDDLPPPRLLLGIT